MKILAMVAVLFIAAACAKDATGGDKQAGTLTVRLTTPNADDGAMSFRVSGGPIDSALAVSQSLRLFTRADGATVVGVVVGALGEGAVITLHVPDVGDFQAYLRTLNGLPVRAP